MSYLSYLKSVYFWVVVFALEIAGVLEWIVLAVWGIQKYISPGYHFDKLGYLTRDLVHIWYLLPAILLAWATLGGISAFLTMKDNRDNGEVNLNGTRETPSAPSTE
jgi:hypothetical protein